MRTKSEKKPKQGRPTKYKPEYCQKLIDHMAKGYSFESFGAIINVARSTVEDWVKAQECFRGAKEEAFLRSREFWERQGIEGLWSGDGDLKINPTIWIFNMKNRFGWRDKVENTGEISVTPYIIKRRNGEEVELGVKQEQDKN